MVNPAPGGAFDASLLRRVEDCGLNASAPPQQRWMDGWLVRYSPGKAKRARCVNAVAAGQRPLQDKLDECARVFREHRLPFFFRITPFTLPSELDAELARREWHPIEPTQVMVRASLDDMTGALGPGVMPQGLSAEVLDARGYAACVGALRGTPAAQIDAHAERLKGSPVPYRGVAWRRQGMLVACGQYALEAELVGLYDVFTAEHARGQGLAQALCRQLLGDAAAAGARAAYLQVSADNLAARAVYARLGFADAYTYHYRCADAQAA
jgi:GNAT superfamily N-acetyltransferase